MARLRAVALERGIGEIAMSPVRTGGARPPVVRLGPIALPASAQVRLRRLSSGATYKEEAAQLLVPVPDGGNAATTVRTLLEELVPRPDAGADGGTL